jgi:hypothetical protein
MEAHEKQLRQLEEDKTGEKTLAKLAELKTGREGTFPKLADPARHWAAIPRRKPPGAAYAKQCRLTLERFAAFAADHQRGVTEFVAIKPETAKAGETVDIPVFPVLRKELERARTATGGNGYCFPAAAEMYRNNPDGITWRVKQVLAKALDTAPQSHALPVETAETVRARGVTYLDRLGATSKAEKMRAVFKAYMAGQTLDQVMAATGCSRGSVSGYLSELERETGCRIVRGHRRALKTDRLQAERENGKRRASVRDFHSFRVTWITLALAAGVPLELVQRVTGHRTTEVVMKHYFRPGREDFRAAIFKAMPKMLADGGQRSVKDQMREIIERMTARTWKRDRARLLEMNGAEGIPTTASSSKPQRC